MAQAQANACANSIQKKLVFFALWLGLPHLSNFHGGSLLQVAPGGVYYVNIVCFVACDRVGFDKLDTVI